MGKMQIADHKAEFLLWLATEKHLRKSTLRGYKALFSVLEKYDPECEFETEALRKFIVYLKEVRGLQNSSINEKLSKLVVLGNFLCPDNNPAQNLSKFKVTAKIPVVLSPQECEDLFTAPIEYSGKGCRGFGPDFVKQSHDLIFEFLAKTGCRLGEAVNLKIEDVNLLEGYFVIAESKTAQQRLVPLAPDLTQKITNHIKKYDLQPADLVFSTSSKNRYSPSHLRKDLIARAKLIGLKKKVHPHLFRHSFVTTLLKENTSILTIARIVGHSKLETTQRYTHLVIQDLQTALLRHPLVKKGMSPEQILEQVKQKFEEMGLHKDKRLSFSLQETEDSLKIEIKIK